MNKIPKSLNIAVRRIACASSYEIGLYDAILDGRRTAGLRPRLRHLKHVAERRMAMLAEPAGTKKSLFHYLHGNITGRLRRFICSEQTISQNISLHLHHIENLCHAASVEAAAHDDSRQLDVILRKCGQDVVFSK